MAFRGKRTRSGAMEAAESPSAGMAKVDDGCGEVDFLSQLPDELLSHILSFLMVQEAILAKLLSRRWRHLFPENPTLSFSANGICGDGGNTFSRHPELESDPKESVAFVNRVMQQFRAPKIGGFVFRQSVGREFAATVDEWIRIACLMKPERIDIYIGCNCFYTFPLHLLHASVSSNLKHLRLSNCYVPSLANLAATSIISLRTPSLYDCYQDRDNFEAMPSYFPNLEKITFCSCWYLPCMQNLCGLWCRFSYLKSLSVMWCGHTEVFEVSHVEDFEISHVKLTNFKYIGPVNKISLKGLNCLQALDLNIKCSGSTFAYFLSILPKEAPQLRRLSIGSINWEDFRFPSSVSTFKCLKHLALSIDSFHVVDIRNLSIFLQYAPVLQEMKITLYTWHTKWSSGWLEERLGLGHKRLCKSHEKQHEYNTHHSHSQLKKITVETLDFGMNDVELLIVLLKTATSLKEMILLARERENLEELRSALAQCYGTVQFLARDISRAA